MALETKNFAAVARATNAIYFYVTTDTAATAVAANYFDSKDLVGQVKVGDIIFINASDKLVIAKVTTVTAATGAIVIDAAFTEA